MWEDPMNTKGSEFRITFIDLKPDLLDTYWEALIFKLIGESFINSEAVNFAFGNLNLLAYRCSNFGETPKIEVYLEQEQQELQCQVRWIEEERTDQSH